MGIQNSELPKYDLFDGINDSTDYGLRAKIKSIRTPEDPAIDLTGKLK